MQTLPASPNSSQFGVRAANEPERAICIHILKKSNIWDQSIDKKNKIKKPNEWYIKG